MKSKVLFTRTISPEMVLTMYEKLGKELSGHIAIKLHSTTVPSRCRIIGAQNSGVKKF